MVAYGLGILPLICELKACVTNVNQPWYADHAGARGIFDALQCYMAQLQTLGLQHSYYPEPSKSILVLSPQNH